MYMKFLDIPTFIISLAVGLFLVYISNPNPTVIKVYPTPENKETIQYVDKADNCYTFKPTEIKCPDNVDKIMSIPIQS